MKKQYLLDALEKTGMLRLFQFIGHERGNHLFVLAYHRVDVPDSIISMDLYDLVSVRPQQFEEQMRLISRYYNPVSAKMVLEAMHGNTPLPRQAVLVTVDDGYRDFKDVIFPIIKKYGIEPVLFIPTSFVDAGIFWWDRLHFAIKTTSLRKIDTPLGVLSLDTPIDRQHAFSVLANYVRKHGNFREAYAEIEALSIRITPKDHQPEPYVLNWDDLRSLAAEGVTIGAHTHTHPIMSHISADEARLEVRQSMEVIKKEIGHVLPIFAYPDGRDHAVNTEVANLLRQEGIEIAFTMEDNMGGLLKNNLLLFPRLIPYLNQSLSQFHLKLTAFQSLRAGRAL